MSRILPDRFLRGTKKGHQPFEPWRATVDGLERVLKGVQQFEMLFFFYLPLQINTGKEVRSQ